MLPEILFQPDDYYMKYLENMPNRTYLEYMNSTLQPYDNQTDT